MTKVSIIIPTYNEQNTIASCLRSLSNQSYKDLEIIVVDDGSTDKTVKVLLELQITNYKLQILKQNHIGPGAARNLGAKIARGKILVFVDADMEFDKDFIKRLIDPIIRGQATGTFSKNENLLNKENIWARFWNINLGRSPEKMHPDDYPDTQPVFRAILKQKFISVGGFDENIGYTDDWSISRKLGLQATGVKGAIFYHKNPENLDEVWHQARWFGKNEFLTGSLIRKLFNLVRYSLIVSIANGIMGSWQTKDIRFFVFKVVYDGAVSVSVLISFFGEQKYK